MKCTYCTNRITLGHDQDYINQVKAMNAGESDIGEKLFNQLILSGEKEIAHIWENEEIVGTARANADFIVRAVNSHEAMLTHARIAATRLKDAAELIMRTSYLIAALSVLLAIQTFTVNKLQRQHHELINQVIDLSNLVGDMGDELDNVERRLHVGKESVQP